jgi:hypothetical protein
VDGCQWLSRGGVARREVGVRFWGEEEEESCGFVVSRQWNGGGRGVMV